MKRACAALLVLTGCAAGNETEREIRVRVFDSKGVPMAGAKVTWLFHAVLGTRFDTLIAAADTDSAGIAFLPTLLIFGDVAVTAIGPGHARATLRLRCKGSSGIDVDLDLPAAATIDGVLEDPTGAPVTGARIDFHLETPGRDLRPFAMDLIDESVTTDEAGRFQCTSLDGAAEYRVAVSHAGQGMAVLGPDRLQPKGGFRIVARRRDP